MVHTSYKDGTSRRYNSLIPSLQITASSSAKPDPWSDDGIREDQKENPDIKPILKFKESCSVRPSWQMFPSTVPLLSVIQLGTHCMYEMVCCIENGSLMMKAALGGS